MRSFMLAAFSVSLLLLLGTEVELATNPGSTLFTTTLGTPAVICIAVSTALFYLINPRMRKGR